MFTVNRVINYKVAFTLYFIFHFSKFYGTWCRKNYYNKELLLLLYKYTDNTVQLNMKPIANAT